MNTLIALLIVILLGIIFYTLMFKGGEKLGEKKLKFIKNKNLRGFVGVMILLGIINAVVYILFEIF